MREFNLFFAGETTYLNDMKRQYNANQLLSQYLERGAIKEWVEYKKTHPECTSKLMIDSGAYSAWNKGAKVDIDDYLKLIKEIQDYCNVFVALDVIPSITSGAKGGPVITYEESSQQSWDNFLYMYERVDCKDKLMPVFHGGEDFKWLKKMLEFRDENGNQLQYLGLSVGSGSKQGREQWFDKCFKCIKESSNPNVKTHSFGMTEKTLMEKFPFYSSDSTSYVKQGVYGAINIGLTSSYTISNRGVHKPNHISHAPKEVREYVDGVFKTLGTTLKDLENTDETTYKYIVKFNFLEFLKWSHSFAGKEASFANSIEKPDLW